MLSVCLLLCGCKCSLPIFMVLWVGWQCMIVVILTNFLDVSRDTDPTKVASGMRRNFYSVMHIIKKPAQGLNSIRKSHQM